MSFSVTRPKSRRKFPHEAKNLDEVLNPSMSSNKSKQKSYDELSKRRSSSHHRRHQRSRSSSDFSSGSNLASAASISASAPRRTARKGAAAEDHDFFDLETISFQLGPIIYEMDDMGNWTSYPSVSQSESKSSSKGSIPLDFKESIAGLSNENKRITRENYLLRVKNEVLADMVARKTLRKDKLQKELERLRKLLSSSSSRFSISSDK